MAEWGSIATGQFSQGEKVKDFELEEEAVDCGRQDHGKIVKKQEAVTIENVNDCGYVRSGRAWHV